MRKLFRTAASVQNVKVTDLRRCRDRIRDGAAARNGIVAADRLIALRQVGNLAAVYIKASQLRTPLPAVLDDQALAVLGPNDPASATAAGRGLTAADAASA